MTLCSAEASPAMGLIMYQPLKRACWFLACAILSASVPNARAESTVNVGNSQLGLRLEGVDDHITCSLNGTAVGKLDFGQPSIMIDLTSKLKGGSNALTCQVIDDNGGTCYSYGFGLWMGSKLVGPNESVTEVMHEGFACCTSSCARANPVLNETIFINSP
jgi:hypothetical protein